MSLKTRLLQSDTCALVRVAFYYALPSQMPGTQAHCTAKLLDLITRVGSQVTVVRNKNGINHVFSGILS